MAEIERLMLEEDFNVSEVDLTIPNNNESDKMIIKSNETSINKRPLTSSPVIKNNKTKAMRKEAIKQANKSHE